MYPTWLHTFPTEVTVDISPAIFGRAGVAFLAVDILCRHISLANWAESVSLVTGQGDAGGRDIGEEPHRGGLGASSRGREVTVVIVGHLVVTHHEGGHGGYDVGLHEVRKHQNGRQLLASHFPQLSDAPSQYLSKATKRRVYHQGNRTSRPQKPFTEVCPFWLVEEGVEHAVALEAPRGEELSISVVNIQQQAVYPGGTCESLVKPWCSHTEHLGTAQSLQLGAE